jgi:PAS domain S-box-containing protein
MSEAAPLHPQWFALCAFMLAFALAGSALSVHRLPHERSFLSKRDKNQIFLFASGWMALALPHTLALRNPELLFSFLARAGWAVAIGSGLLLPETRGRRLTAIRRIGLVVLVLLSFFHDEPGERSLLPAAAGILFFPEDIFLSERKDWIRLCMAGLFLNAAASSAIDADLLLDFLEIGLLGSMIARVWWKSGLPGKARIALLLFLGVFPFVLAGAARWTDASERNARDLAFRNAGMQLELMKNRMEINRRHGLDLLKSLAADPIVSAAADHPEDRSDFSFRILNRRVGAQAIYMLDAEGLVFVASDPAMKHRNFAHRRFFREALGGNANMQYVREASGKAAVHYARPFLDAQGEIAAVIAMKFDLERFVEDDVRFNRAIVHHRGAILAGPEGLSRGALFPFSEETRESLLAERIFEPRDLHPLGYERTDAQWVVDPDGNPWMMASVPLAGGVWELSKFLSADPILAHRDQRIQLAVLLFSIMVLLSLRYLQNSVFVHMLKEEVKQRRRAEGKLLEAKADLERQVRERTRELRDQILAKERTLTERKRVEEALRESEERFRVLFHRSPDPLFIFRLDDTILDMNDAACEMLGYGREELLSMRLPDIQAPSARKRTEGIIRSELAVSKLEGMDLRKDGTEIPVEIVTVPIRLEGEDCALSAVRDITDRKRAEAEREEMQARLFQAQKMESVGRLAGGVAHDFNNLLQAMSGNIQLLLMKRTGNHPDANRLKSVAGTIDRAARLVRQLLLFGRKAEIKRERVDLNREVGEAAAILERTIPKMIRIELDMDESIRPIHADPVQVEQVLLNLGGNAADAMPRGGRLLLRTRNAVIGTGAPGADRDIRPGRYVLLSVADTGTGMDPETAKHVFEPFFTTKEIGKGTGLGLASVFGIVKGHGGEISCESEPDKGTTFSVFWPAMESDSVAPRVESPSKCSPERGEECVLVVDDEETIRELTAEMLVLQGYTVLLADSGEQALAVYAKESASIDLVILDLNMPGMGGLRCLRELRKRNPDVRVLVASGYSVQAEAREVMRAGAAGFIGKPYRHAELLERIRDVLRGCS